MNESQIAELQKSIELAQAGQWMPATIVAGFLGLIIVLLLYIYRKDRSVSDKRHTDSEEQLKIAIESNQKLTVIVERHDVKIENLEKRMK